MKSSEELIDKWEKDKVNWMKESLHVTYSKAKVVYFLTDKMLKNIGEPDLIKPNPHYKSAAPMKLYLKDRLEAWVVNNSHRVEKSMLRRQKLSKIQLEVHQKRRKKLISEINNWIPQLDLAEITKEFLDETEKYYRWRYDDFEGDLTGNVICSYIRHCYTDYEDFLGIINQYRGKTGVSLIYPLIKKRVNDLIIEKFNLQINEIIEINK